MLAQNEIMLGWSKAEGLLNEELTKVEFREIIHKEYFPREETKRRAGQIAGDLWRFIREMKVGHLILVHTKGGFFIGKVTGPAYYNEMKIFNDTAYRRKVEWLQNKEPISEDRTPEDLVKRLNTIQSVIDATSLYQEIEFALRMA
ncbi:MAG: hypothetical protein ACTSSH_02095 [Candidatus Heimdallarchaeota archaeon]